MKISIHQPYWAPYLGHFRLFEQSDLHVVYDDVQFIRRGFIHRNKFKDANGMLQWLTLPLEHAPQDTPIHQMKFAADAGERMAAQMRRFSAFDRLPAHILYEVQRTHGSLSTYLVGLLETCCWEIGVKVPPLAYSSGLNLPDSLRGQDRILEICRRLGATEYLNAPGGRSLYDEEAFAERGIKLEFLPPWTGDYGSVLEKIADKESACST